MPGKAFPYHREFSEEKTKTIISRLRPFCIISASLFIGVSIIGYLQDPYAFQRSEFFSWAILLASAAAALFVNRYVKTLREAKLNAALFSTGIVLALTALFYVYPDYITMADEIFALNLFFVSFIIPWQAFEVVLIGLIHLAGYSAAYRWAEALASAKDVDTLIYAQGGYVDGCIFFAVALAICVIIRKRDEYNDRHRFSLLRELSAKNEQMAKELDLARDIHKTLIPKSTSTQNVAIAVSYLPLSAVGGDYATFHVTKDGNLFFLIGDVTGHGVPAALLVNRIYGEVESLVTKNPDPGVLMRELNAFVQEHFTATQMYFTVCSGLVDFQKKTLFYSNYGHPPQILRQHKDNTIRYLESQTYFLGIDGGGADQKVFEGRLEFDHKDRLVLFTDGLIETQGIDGELYGMERLEKFTKLRKDESPTLFNSDVMNEIDIFRRGPVTDDMFLVTIDIK